MEYFHFDSTYHISYLLIILCHSKIVWTKKTKTILTLGSCGKHQIPTETQRQIKFGSCEALIDYSIWLCLNKHKETFAVYPDYSTRMNVWTEHQQTDAYSSYFFTVNQFLLLFGIIIRENKHVWVQWTYSLSSMNWKNNN